MEFKEENGLVYTKDGRIYKLIKSIKVCDLSTLEPYMIYIVDDNGLERAIAESEVVKVENNSINN